MWRRIEGRVGDGTDGEVWGRRSGAVGGRRKGIDELTGLEVALKSLLGSSSPFRRTKRSSPRALDAPRCLLPDNRNFSPI